MTNLPHNALRNQRRPHSSGQSVNQTGARSAIGHHRPTCSARPSVGIRRADAGDWTKRPETHILFVVDFFQVFVIAWLLVLFVVLPRFTSSREERSEAGHELVEVLFTFDKSSLGAWILALFIWAVVARSLFMLGSWLRGVGRARRPSRLPSIARARRALMFSVCSYPLRNWLVADLRHKTGHLISILDSRLNEFKCLDVRHDADIHSAQ